MGYFFKCGDEFNSPDTLFLALQEMKESSTTYFSEQKLLVVIKILGYIQVKIYPLLILKIGSLINYQIIKPYFFQNHFIATIVTI